MTVHRWVLRSQGRVWWCQACGVEILHREVQRAMGAPAYQALWQAPSPGAVLDRLAEVPCAGGDAPVMHRLHHRWGTMRRDGPAG